jgi:hypothetical protein
MNFQTRCPNLASFANEKKVGVRTSHNAKELHKQYTQPRGESERDELKTTPYTQKGPTSLPCDDLVRINRLIPVANLDR